MILSVVIVNWNTGDLLAGCLDSVTIDLQAAGMAADEAEVFVVDNFSSDRSVEIAIERHPDVKLIRNSDNPGFAAANNQAIRCASGVYILLLNPDTVIKPGSLPALIAFLEAHPKAGAAGPRLLNPDGSLQHSCSPEPSLSGEFLRLFHAGGRRPDGYYPMETWEAAPRTVDSLLGACILARRSALEAVAGFDESYFMYSEEVDLCRRLRQAGWELYWDPTAEVVHYGGQSTRLAAGEMFLQLYRAKVVYFRRHGGNTSARMYKFILFAAGLARVAAGALALFRPADGRQQHLDIARNYRRLLASLPGM